MSKRKLEKLITELKNNPDALGTLLVMNIELPSFVPFWSDPSVRMRATELAADKGDTPVSDCYWKLKYDVAADYHLGPIIKGIFGENKRKLINYYTYGLNEDGKKAWVDVSNYFRSEIDFVNSSVSQAILDVSLKDLEYNKEYNRHLPWIIAEVESYVAVAEEYVARRKCGDNSVFWRPYNQKWW